MKTDIKKTVQSFHYLLTNVDKEGLTVLELLKLLFLADRYCFRAHGRIISFNKYCAMEYGPVPSLGKSLLNRDRRNVTLEEINYCKSYLQMEYDHIKHPNFQMKVFPVKNENSKSLTGLDKIFLNKALYTYDNVSDIVDYCHQLPEWKKYEHLLSQKRVKSLEMDFLDFLENSNEVLEFDPKGLDDIEFVKKIYTTL